MFLLFWYFKNHILHRKKISSYASWQIATHILTTYLLTYPTSIAYIIDTLGTFDVLRLEKVISTRLERHRHGRQQERCRGKEDEQQTGNDVDVQAGNVVPTDHKPVNSDAVSKATRAFRPPSNPAWPVATTPMSAENCASTTDEHRTSETATATTESVLERVRIIRVFDFIGLEEAVAEIRDELRRQADISPRSGLDDGARNQAEVFEKLGVNERDADRSEKRESVKRKEVIFDSEDEDSDKEMLLRPTDTDKAQEKPGDRVVEMEQKTKGMDKRGLMIIDSFTHVVNPLLKRNFVFGK